MPVTVNSYARNVANPSERSIAFLFLTGFVTHIIARHVLRPFSFWFRNLLARIKHNALGPLG